MAFKLKDKIWPLFGNRANEIDLYQDVNGRGLQQRFNELLMEDFDDNEGLLIINMVELTRDPFDMLERFIPYEEQRAGGLPLISSDTYTRRKLVAFYRQIAQRKGTHSGYCMLFYMMGFTGCTINEIANPSGFDSPVNFDDPFRRFDGACATCSKYDVNLTGSLTITPAIVTYIFNVIEYNEPINAELRFVSYNGSTIVGGTVHIIGDDVTFDFPIVNDLATRDTLVQVYQAYGVFATIDVQVNRPTTAEIRVIFGSPPVTGEDYYVLLKDTTEAYDITGDDVTSNFTISHGLASKDVIVQVVQNFASDYSTADAQVHRFSTTQVKIDLLPIPATGEDYRVLLLPASYAFDLVGDDATISFIITHSLTTKDLFTEVYDKTTGLTVDVNVHRTNDDQITVVFQTAPTTGTDHRLVINQ